MKIGQKEPSLLSDFKDVLTVVLTIVLIFGVLLRDEGYLAMRSGCFFMKSFHDLAPPLGNVFLLSKW